MNRAHVSPLRRLPYALILASLSLACSDDPETPDGTGGTGGQAGKGGSGQAGSTPSGGSGGRSGSAGTAGAGGSSGSAGTAGVGGTGGSAGTAGVGGTGGSAGTAGLAGSAGSAGSTAGTSSGAAGATAGNGGTTAGGGAGGESAGQSGAGGEGAGQSGAGGESAGQGGAGTAGSAGVGGSSAGAGGSAGLAGSGAGVSGSAGSTSPAGAGGSAGAAGGAGAGGGSGNPLPATCQAATVGLPSEGDYTLYVGGNALKPWTAHCAGGKEYLTLMTTAGKNFSQYLAGGASPGTTVTTTYQRVRLDPVTLLIDPNDQTFTTSTGSLKHSGGEPVVTSMPYGVAMACNSNNTIVGVANVSLVGTAFTVAPDLFTLGGAGSHGTVTYSVQNRVVDLAGGGFCGWEAVKMSFAPYNKNGVPMQLVYAGL